MNPLHKYNNIAEEESVQSQNKWQSDFDTTIDNSFTSHLRICQESSEKSARLHLEFWSHLSRDNPDLASLSELAFKIDNSVANAEGQWNKLVEMYPKSSEAFEAYAKFLTEVRYDKEAGERIMRRAREMNTHEQKKIDSNEYHPVNDAGEDMKSEEHKSLNPTFESSQALIKANAEKSQLCLIRYLRKAAKILLIILFIITPVTHILDIKGFNELKHRMHLVALSNQQNSELQRIVMDSQSLLLMNMGIATNHSDKFLRERVGNATSDMENIGSTLQIGTLQLSASHLNLLRENSIEMQTFSKNDQRSNIHVNLNEAAQQIVSKARKVIYTPLENLNASNSDLHYVLYNSFNHFYRGLRQSSEFYTSEVYESFLETTDGVLIFLIVPACLILLVLIVLISGFSRAIKGREEALALLSAIPDETVKALQSKCRIFISSLEAGDGDNNEEENFENQIDSPSDSTEQHRRKDIKNIGRSRKRPILRLIISASSLLLCLVGQYTHSIYFLNQIIGIFSDFDSASSAESLFGFVLNAERYKLIGYSPS